MFVLYNALLRGFGFCGAVEAGIDFGSAEFWAQWKAIDIDTWFKRSGHKFTNTIHALCSAIKKLQAIADDAPGTLLYRGLGALSVREFLASLGFTDRAFLSTTKDRDVALEYSGVKQSGVGTVLCIETSTTNNGAVIVFFSQYPGEVETVWNACSHIQHLPGKVQVVLPAGGGVVRIYLVLVSANSRALTVEELEGRRKKVVDQVLDTLHADVCRFVTTEAATAEFKARVKQDPSHRDCKDLFTRSILDESAARVSVYKALPDSAYAAVETLGEAVSQGLTLPLLACAKLRLWLEDPSLELWRATDLGFNAAQGRRLARRRLLLQDSAAGRRGSADSQGRIVEDGLGRMGGAATAALALEDCRERRLLTGADATMLERKDLFSGETPLITQIQLGERENAQRLLQAGADANAATADGERPLHIAAKEGRDDLVQLLAEFQAEVDGADQVGRTALHSASQGGHHAAVQVLLKLGANVEATDTRGGLTCLHYAARHGHSHVVRLLLGNGADAAKKTKNSSTALWLACENEHEAAAAELMEATKLAGALDLQACGVKVSALHCASAKGLAVTVSKLLSFGADATLTDKDGKTPVDDAKTEGVKAALAEHALLAAILLDREEQVAEHIAKGADLVARDPFGRTALLLACAHGHEAAAVLLAEPSQAAGVLDAVGDDGFSALLWAEERGLVSVSQKLRDCGAAAVRRPALALFRGQCSAVHIKVAERTVACAHSFVTVRSAQRCPLGAKGYYELEILDRDDLNPQYGFASPAFERVLGASEEGVGDDEHSWAVDGARQCKWHNGNEAYPCTWNVGDVIGLACDLNAMQMHVSVNGSFAAPNGVVFELAPDATCHGLFAAFSGCESDMSVKVRYNLGEVPFKHAPPAEDYQAFAAFEA